MKLAAVNHIAIICSDYARFTFIKDPDGLPLEFCER